MSRPDAMRPGGAPCGASRPSDPAPTAGFDPARFRRLRPAQEGAGLARRGADAIARRLRPLSLAVLAAFLPGAAGAATTTGSDPAPAAIDATGLAPGEAVLIDIDALTDGRDAPIMVSLSAGDYMIDLGEGAFTAWNAWSGDVSGCDAEGRNCEHGWLNQSVLQSSLGEILIGDIGRYATAELAMASFVSVAFSLFEDETVAILNPDSWQPDNLGGVSLSLMVALAEGVAAPMTSNVAVPLPATAPFAIGAFAALALVSRRRWGSVGQA